MAVRRTEVLLAMSLVVALCGAAVVNAESNCTSVILRLAPCLDYVTGYSSMPSPPCCTQLGDLVKSQPQCLCYALHGGAAALGIKLNQTQAESLPSACKVQNPPCNVSPPPPASSPVNPPPPMSSPPPVSAPPPASVPPPVTAPPADSPSGNAPSSSGSGEGKSHGNSIKKAYCVLVFFLSVTTALTFI